MLSLNHGNNAHPTGTDMNHAIPEFHTLLQINLFGSMNDKYTNDVANPSIPNKNIKRSIFVSISNGTANAVILAKYPIVNTIVQYKNATRTISILEFVPVYWR